MATSVPGSLDDQSSRNRSEGQPSFPPAPGCFGLIGGLGPPSTVHYYQALLGAHAARGVPARLFIAHADMGHALGLVAAKDQVGLARYLASLIQSLASAGASFSGPGLCYAHTGAFDEMAGGHCVQ